MQTRRAALAATTAALLAVTAPAAGRADAGRAAGRVLPSHLRGVGDASQVVEVVNGGYGETTALVRAFEVRDGTWRQVFGPWTANVGYNGFAPPGQKREGDGRTPSGSFGFSFFFGVDRRPSGIRFPWRHAYSYDYWDDDPASPRYNEWVDTRRHSAGRDPEPMLDLPSYQDAAVIAYNVRRVPGRGSAIFLHVTHHDATTGCVSLPRPDVIALLRWLDPADHPRIVMGTAATVTR
ncbi:MAG TPA: L,D-transpeptidase family protein [Mycobacteriales bacterium]|nr:L,D-transpeptidase family protein [Mycobacteriales bacterium]